MDLNAGESVKLFVLGVRTPTIAAQTIPKPTTGGGTGKEGPFAV